MTAKKVCMLGTLAVGKTSLVRRFVESLFDERYLTTIGVKVDKKKLRIGARELTLMIWDVHGDDDLQQVRPWHLRGSHGYLLVADGTRRRTVAAAVAAQERARAELGDVPFLLLLNKRDLAAEWEVGPEELAPLEAAGWRVVETSALSGEGVEAAFEELGRRMLGDG